jgi:hypothetical protein
MTQDTSVASRHAFPEKLAKQVQSQFTQFAHNEMTGYTVARVKSEFYGAKTDLTVFDSEGKLVLNGRDFGDRIFFWQP